MNSMKDPENQNRTVMISSKEKGWQDLAWWLQVTSGAALLLMSLYQSGAYLMKYLSHPTVTSITFQPHSVDDVPAITICPRPSYNPGKWADFLGKLAGEEFVEDAYIAGRAVRALANRNVSFEQFAKQVAIPMVTTIIYCAFGSTDDDCDPYPNVWSPIYYWENENFTVPKETPSGQWLTRAIEENVDAFNDNIAYCSTFVSNVTLKPGLARQIIIDIDSGIIQSPPNRLPSWRWTDWLNSSYVVPFWNIYIHDRMDAVPSYALMNTMQPVKVKHSTVTKIGFKTDRYTSLSTKEVPCLDNPQYSPQKCRQACYEQYILPCTMPGIPQENTSQIILSSKKPSSMESKSSENLAKVCNMSSDQFDSYHQVKSFIYTRNGSDFAEEAMAACCPKKCRHYSYAVEILSEVPMGIDPAKEAYKAKIFIGPLSATIRSIDEQEAYDLDQFLGELGGAWGLFLGASIVNVLALVYEACHRLYDRFSARKQQ